MVSIRQLFKDIQGFFPFTCIDAILNEKAEPGIDYSPKANSSNLVRGTGVARYVANVITNDGYILATDGMYYECEHGSITGLIRIPDSTREITMGYGAYVQTIYEYTPEPSQLDPEPQSVSETKVGAILCYDSDLHVVEVIPMSQETAEISQVLPYETKFIEMTFNLETKLNCFVKYTDGDYLWQPLEYQANKIITLEQPRVAMASYTGDIEIDEGAIVLNPGTLTLYSTERILEAHNMNLFAGEFAETGLSYLIYNSDTHAFAITDHPNGFILLIYSPTKGDIIGGLLAGQLVSYKSVQVDLQEVLNRLSVVESQLNGYALRTITEEQRFLYSKN